MQTFPVLRSERLILDAIKTEDRQHVFDIFSDADVVRYYDVGLFESMQDSDNLIAFFQSRFDSGTGIRWAIRLKSEDRLIGTCGFNTWNEFDYSAILGYELVKSQWGKGLASEAVSTILSFVYSSEFPLAINRIEASIVPGNIASEKLALQLGFKLEGCLRQKGFWAQQFHDMNLYSLLKQDWCNKQN